VGAALWLVPAFDVERWIVPIGEDYMRRRLRFAGLRVHGVSLIVNTTARGGRKIERLLPRLASRTQSPLPSVTSL